jgi:hypothetical protein
LLLVIDKFELVRSTAAPWNLTPAYFQREETGEIHASTPTMAAAAGGEGEDGAIF